MLERGGGCTFVGKVRNAEKIGVKFVIIADSKVEYTEDLVMADDGSGETITIPSMLIRKASADKIRESIADENRVIVKINLDFPHTGTGKVDIDLWYSEVFDFSNS